MSDELDQCVSMLVREHAKRVLGRNCTWADDDIRILAVLASRAVLAGLASDLPTGWREAARVACEIDRDTHEAVLGHKIEQQDWRPAK